MDLANWALRTSPKFTTGVQCKVYRELNTKGNNMPKSSHIAPNSYSSRNESCGNNNMGTNVSVHFKELNDIRGNLMAV